MRPSQPGPVHWPATLSSIRPSVSEIAWVGLTVGSGVADGVNGVTGVKDGIGEGVAGVSWFGAASAGRAQ